MVPAAALLIMGVALLAPAGVHAQDRAVDSAEPLAAPDDDRRPGHVADVEERDDAGRSPKQAGAADVEQAPSQPKAKPKRDGDSERVVAAGGAYGAGAATMGAQLLLQMGMSTAAVTGVLVPGLGAALAPLNTLLNLMSLLLCCGLPAAHGAAVAATGDLLVGGEPGLHWLWTILASYGACWGGGVLLALAQLGIGTLLLGPPFALSQVHVNGIPLANLSPTQAGIAAAVLVGTTGVFVAAQPLVPAAVWVLTAAPPDDEHLPNLPRHRRAELKPPSRRETVAMAF